MARGTRLRERLAAAQERAAPLYGLFAGIAIALPLLVGTLTERPTDGVIVALGAYLAAVRAPDGTYGQKARSYGVIVPVIGAGQLIGAGLAGHPWASVAVLPLLVIVGTLVPRIGLTLALAAVFAAIRPPGGGVLHGALLSMAGALLMMALVLAPWPGRRLRPLTEALSETTAAVAEALEAVTGPTQDWERARRRASETIGRARATYGMYRTASEDNRPTRLIKTIVKLLHEVVALRALLEAESARPLHDDPATETQAVVAVSAARIRLLAAAIANPAEHLPADPERLAMPVSQGALNKLEVRVDEARREAFDGNEDMVAAALASQAWRSMRRLNATIDSAARIVAAGITLKPVLVPRLPEPPRPTSLWRRVVEALKTWPPSLRYALRAGITMLAAMAIWALLDIKHGHWLPLATLMCLRGTYGETVNRVLERVGGTAVGSIIAALLLVLAPGRPTLVAIIFVLAVVGFALSPVGYLWWVVLCTPLVMMIVDFGEPEPWSTSAVRIALTIGGSALALAAARLLWPAAPTDHLPARLSTLLNRHAEVIRTAATKPEPTKPEPTKPEPTKPEPAKPEPAKPEAELGSLLSERLRPALLAATAVNAEADRLVHDPLPDTDLITRLREAVRSAHRIRDEVITLTGMSRAESTDAGPVSAILVQLADYLEESAEAVESGDDRPPPLDLDDLLTDLDAQLSSLVKRRRAEVEAGTDLDDTTPLRSDLLSIAAVRHAVRQLRSDAQALARAPFPAEDH